jgi:DNA-directed RNA polymerase specialized sigma24 family protein
VAAWLRAREGRARVRRALDRHRLPPALADDLAQEVLCRAWRALGRGEVINSVPAFVTVLLARAAVDVVRGRARRGELAEAPAGAGASSLEGAHDGDPVGETVAVVLDRPGADGVRRELHGLAGPQPVAGAAALAYVTLVADDVPPLAGCPAPEGGVDPDEALAWAALWCSGRDDCFDAGAAGAIAPGAVRARRSRALRAMRALLARAAAPLQEVDRA